MSTSGGRPHRVGGLITDLCRACKAVRDHTVMALDADGRARRVVCDVCGSQHNYRGGGDEGESETQRTPPPAIARSSAGRARLAPAAPAPREAAAPNGAADASPAPPAHPREIAREVPLEVSLEVARERTHERKATAMPSNETSDAATLESLLRRVLREELGLTPLAPASRWRGGQMVLRPGRPGLQEKALPIDALFHKVVMIRNKLRTLEQQLNAAEVPEDLKLRLQGYISGCYGSLTSFNVLFADEADQFKGTGGD